MMEFLYFPQDRTEYIPAVIILLLVIVAAMVAAPLQNSLGDGGLYTLWAGLLIVVGLLIALLIWKGKEWREHDVRKVLEKLR